VLAFAVADGARLEPLGAIGGPVPGFPDGIEVDAAGRIYVSSADGVRVLGPAGRLIGVPFAAAPVTPEGESA